MTNVTRFAYTFLIDETTGDFLLSDDGKYYLIVDASVLLSPTDSVVYVFAFSNLAAAERDLIVGSFFNAPQIALEVLVFADMTVNSVNSYSGYWFMVMQTGLSATLMNHPNLELVIDNTLLRQGNASVVLANIPFQNVGIVVNAFGNYVPNGLI